MVGRQPGAEHPTDRERKRTRGEREWASSQPFMWFGTVSLRIEGLPVAEGPVFCSPVLA